MINYILERSCMNCEEKILHLQNTPISWLRHELLVRLQTALSDLPAHERLQLIIQLLEIHMRDKRFSKLISLWPRLEKDFPSISSIISDYDYNHQYRQALIVNALEQAIKAVI